MAKRGQRLSGTEVLKLLQSDDFEDKISSDLDGVSSDDEPMQADVLVADCPAIDFVDSGRGNQLTGIDPCYLDSVLFDDVELMQVCIVFCFYWLFVEFILRISYHRHSSYNDGNTQLSCLLMSPCLLITADVSALSPFLPFYL